MQIIIPMSGIGKRFVEAGYTVPKPLIEVDGMPIIEHIVRLFDKKDSFIFICNQEHLDTTPMRAVLKRIAPYGKVVAIPPHKLGPVYAVLQASEYINLDEEVIVNYCDFSMVWDYSKFLKTLKHKNADGAIVCYTGFHPHMLGSTHYAFVKETHHWMEAIKEKEPFTENRMQEYASTGTYYFKSGKVMIEQFKNTMAANDQVNGEFYVSLVYNHLVKAGLKTYVYEVPHMFQWGTPDDLEQYQLWSNTFKQLVKTKFRSDDVYKPVDAIVLPMAGLGQRFRERGYKTSKPLLQVSNKPMVVQAIQCCPVAKQVYPILLKGVHSLKTVDSIQAHIPNLEPTFVDDLTEGQASTCALAIQNLPSNASVFIGACDNGMLYSKEAFQKLVSKEDVDAVIFTFKRHPSVKRNPLMYGYVDVEGNNAKAVSVKVPLSNTPQNDHAIVGSFYFSKAELFLQAYEHMVQHDIRVNGEFYVDSLMDVLIQQGYKVKVFEIDYYIGWGTPDDYETFNYWQACFNKCNWHPYYTSKDPMYFSNNSHSISEILRFLVSGCSAVASDAGVYSILAHMIPSSYAKGISFIAGSIVAFILNKFWTFKKPNQSFQQLPRFILLYTLTLGVNVAVNECILWIKPSAFTLGFLIATGCSTLLNYLGQKKWVFK